MKLIVGLGNPGNKYTNTRHNVGFVVLDSLNSEEWTESKKGKLVYSWVEVGGEKVELMKPQMFMNDSGIAVSYVRNKHRELSISDMYVIHDDLDIQLGEFKIQRGKGPKDHRGLKSIYEKLGAKDFWHVRVGIDNDRSRITDHGSRITGEDYVLMRFTDSEKSIFENTINKVVEALMSHLIH